MSREYDPVAQPAIEQFDVAGKMTGLLRNIDGFERYARREFALYRYFQHICNTVVANGSEPSVHIKTAQPFAADRVLETAQVQLTTFPALSHAGRETDDQRLISLREKSTRLDSITDQTLSTVPVLAVFRPAGQPQEADLAAENAEVLFERSDLETLCGVPNGGSIEALSGIFLANPVLARQRSKEQADYEMWLNRAAQVANAGHFYDRLGFGDALPSIN